MVQIHTHGFEDHMGHIHIISGFWFCGQSSWTWSYGQNHLCVFVSEIVDFMAFVQGGDIIKNQYKNQSFCNWFEIQ